MTSELDGLRPAAVLMPIFDDQPNEVLFIERATHLRRHAGQIAFPGGAVDAGDADHLAAALREVEEEVGIRPEAVRVVGQLPIVRQRTRGTFAVSPFVAVVRAGTPLVVDPNEAAAVHRVPLAAILRPGAVRRGIHEDAKRRIETYVLDYGALHVWGLTAHILYDFVEDYNAAGSALRRSLDVALGVGH